MGTKTELYHCYKSKDGLCHQGGMKTVRKGVLKNYCYKIRQWVDGLEKCPKEKAINR